MDLLIFSKIADLFVYAVLLVGIPLSLTWIVLQLCRPLFGPENLRRLRWPLFTLLWLLPPAWLYAGYSSFQQQCQTPHPAIISTKANPPVRSFLLDQFGTRDFADQQTFSLTQIRDAGLFDFVEEAIWPSPETTYWRYLPNNRQEIADKAVSQFVVEMPRPEKRNAASLLPVFRAQILIKERASGNILAKAEETIFGGGLAGLYLRAIGGDQDDRYLACGYLSPAIGTWRPTLSSDPRHTAYAKADAQFVTSVLKP